ncbi:hypothetical protein NC651_025062 [Populus alba x Populus x berolinensis]|nr:hypothetical protein NC651_025062 [Populus alba x Populus x berolinensis]
MVLRESQPIWSLKFWSLCFVLALVSGEIKHRYEISASHSMLWFKFLSVVIVSPFCFITSYHCFSFLKSFEILDDFPPKLHTGSFFLSC